MAEQQLTSASTEQTPPSDEVLQTFIDQIKATIQMSLEEKELDAVIKRRLKKMQDWHSMTPEAQTAFSHLLAAEVLSDKAAHIRIDHGVAFNDDHTSAFDQLLTLLRNRRRSTSVSVKPASDDTSP